MTDATDETAAGTAIEGPLADRHRALGAKFAEFGGWSMPLSYTGIVEEHVATRTAVGLFDVSHLGKLLVTGDDTAGFVNRCLTNDLDRIGDGQAQYTLCCDQETGGVVDDLIAYRGEGDVFLIPNAGNTPEVLQRLRADAPSRHRDRRPAPGDRDARRPGAPLRRGARRRWGFPRRWTTWRSNG